MPSDALGLPAIVANRTELPSCGIERATGQLENTSRVRIIRRDIAKMKTVVREKKAPDAGASAKKSGK